jgi:hypothetical protein
VSEKDKRYHAKRMSILKLQEEPHEEDKWQNVDITSILFYI